MRLRSKLKWLLVVAVVAAAGGGTATAQGVPAGTATGADGQVGFQRKPQLSPQEQVVDATNQITLMEQGAASIRRQLEEARAQRDVVKTLCLNDKLSQADVAIRSAKDRLSSLQLAAGRKDAELSNHEFTILTVLRGRGEQLTKEANQCIGEEGNVIGETKNTAVIDPTLPPDDDTNYQPTDPSIIAYPPVCTSCSR